MTRLNIKYQLRLTTLIPVLLVALLFALFYNGQFNKHLNQYLLRLGEAYIRQLLPVAQLALMRDDERTLQGLINASTINPEIKSLAFYNARNQLIAYRGGKYSTVLPFKPPQFTGDYIESLQVSFDTINFIAPITLPKFNLYSNFPLNAVPNFLSQQPNDILGWLTIDIDTQSVLIQRYQMYIITIFITLLGLIISLTVHFFLSKKIYIPILRLRRSMKQILSNEFETHIAVTSPGEMGIIEKGCAYMQQHYLNIVHELDNHIELANKDLQQSLELLEEKNIELSLEKKKTEEKIRQKSEFIANMSHEIRTPMNGIMGFTNVLLESKLDPLQFDYVKTIHASSQDLLTIINDILDYSKMDAGKFRLDCIPLDIRACIDETLALTSTKINKKNIDLIASTDINVPKIVLGDPLRIKQILNNLISNAIKFTERGYIIIKTTIEVETDNNYTLAIAVTDTGMGIAKSDQTKLFNAFNQADTSITRRFGGTGLGLVICKKLAEVMKGKIMLQSEPNKGSTFTVIIKLEKCAAYEIEKYQSQRFSHIKALCFDDNALHLEALCNGVSFWGIECLRIEAISELKHAFKKHSECNIAFINVNERCEKQLAPILKPQTIPIVLLSKWLIQDPKILGADAFLLKPANIQKLYHTLETLLDESSQEVNNSNHTDLAHMRHSLSLIQPAILVADDNKVNRQLFLSIFKQNAVIKTVKNGEEALKACKIKRFDLLLLDLQMPRINGRELAFKIR